MAMAVGVSVCAAVAKESAPIIPWSLEDLAQFRKSPVENHMAVDVFLWVEAGDFADNGAWRLDTQFVHKMGSAYLFGARVRDPGLSRAGFEMSHSAPIRYRALTVRTIRE